MNEGETKEDFMNNLFFQIFRDVSSKINRDTRVFIETPLITITNTDKGIVGYKEKAHGLEFAEILKKHELITSFSWVLLGGQSSDDGNLFEYDEGLRLNLIPRVYIEGFERNNHEIRNLYTKITVYIDSELGLFCDPASKKRYRINQSNKCFQLITALVNKSPLGASELARRANYPLSNKISDVVKEINKQFKKHTGIVFNLIEYENGEYYLNTKKFNLYTK